jgi:hypothetical protein
MAGMNSLVAVETTPRLTRRTWLLSFLVFTVLGVVMVVQSYAFDRSVGRTIYLQRMIITTFASFWVYAALTPAVLWFSWLFPIEKGRWFWRLLLHVAAGLVFTAVHAAVRPAIYPFLNHSAGLSWKTFESTFLFFSFDNVFNTYFPIVGLAHGWLYYHRIRERDVRAARLEAQLANAQLSMLKMQLQPHFLFNTLHAVSALIRENPRAAEEMLEGLGELLRLTLEQQVTQEVPLKTELDFIGRYLNLEQIRFADSLDVTVAADPETLDALVPSMILQPLVENALRHGIAKRARGGVLQVRASRVDETLKIAVEDNGSRVASAESKEGIGLSNTRARLLQLYGGEQSFDLLANSQGGTTAVVSVPFRLVEATGGQGGHSSDDGQELPSRPGPPSELAGDESESYFGSATASRNSFKAS